MRQVGAISWPDLFRSLKLGTLLAALMVVLASCSSNTVLTDSGSLAAKGRPVPAVAFRQITGLPPGRLTEMKTALSIAGGQRDIGFIDGSFQSGTFTIEGQFKVFAESAGVKVVYQWQVRDTEGVLVQTIDGDDNAGVFSGSDPWAAVNSAVVERIARRTAEAMAQKLSQMGYATRLSALSVPPAEYFAQAGPQAGREIDFETVNGPGNADLGMDMIAAADVPLPPDVPEPDRPAVDPIPGEAQLARSIAVAEGDPAAAAPPGDAAKGDNLNAKADKAGPALQDPSAKGDRVRPAPVSGTGRTAVAARDAGGSRKGHAIRAVAVMPVEGSPGRSGDAELTAALRKTLIDAGWPVVNTPQPNALTIVGQVRVAEAGSANQSVSVRWVVRSPDGKTLGDVKQANSVPRGTLDSGWGPVAMVVAEAAASGIFDIVKRYQ
jgi:hypothetical protein